ncbi:hypothetical protein I4U23_010827 [Adineta vaga]|nr:hypothetical protein I4U23_010827 [Adineta vaga]
MVRKKLYRQNPQQEKENVKKENYVPEDSFSLAIESNSPTTMNNVPRVSSIVKEEFHHIEPFSNEKKIDTTIFYDASNKIDGNNTSSERASTYSRIDSGQKRNLENDLSELIQLKKICLEIEKRIEVLETTMMPYPEHSEVVQNIVDDMMKDINDDLVGMNDDKKMSPSNNRLNIDPTILAGLQKDTSTTTARAILKYLYPIPPLNFKLTDIDPTVINDIIATVIDADGEHQ